MKCYSVSQGIAEELVRITMSGPVLIIEDEPDIAEVLSYSLEKADSDFLEVQRDCDLVAV